MYDTCTYFTASGRQLYGVCCDNTVSNHPLRPGKPTSPEIEEATESTKPPKGKPPSNWPPPLPTHPPDHTIPPLPTHPPSPGYPGIEESETTSTQKPTTTKKPRPAKPTTSKPPSNWPPPLPTHPPSPGYPGLEESTTTKKPKPVKPPTNKPPSNWPPPLPTHPPSPEYPGLEESTTTSTTQKPTTTKKPKPVKPPTNKPPSNWPPPLPTHPPSPPPQPWPPSVQPPAPKPPTPKPPTSKPPTPKPPVSKPSKPPTPKPPVPVSTQPTTEGNEIPDISDASCGAKNGFQDQERIVGGQNADPGEWPWIAALFNGGRQFCGGSLIDETHILTAAHCVAHMSSWDVARLTVRLGDHNIKTSSEIKHIEKKVKRVVRHRGFDARTLYNDIALLTLDSPVTFSKQVRSICLPQGRTLYAGKTATVIGWGSLRESGPQPAVLQEVNIPIWTNSECKTKYGTAAPGGIVEHFICAGQATRDSCSGDSGGPLMINDGRWTQVGVVSWGIGCGKGQYPGVYTRVTHFMPWISKNLK
uniref:Phenoloxidase-activating factor 2 n=1 Tax=Clastoptera arizonana TaxID=38151 RepID=A0A1B6D1R4_9HEMI